MAGSLRRNLEGILQRTTHALASANLRPELLPTRSAGDATVRARQAVEAGADLVISLGGDGTVNEIVNGIVGSGVPLAVLPGGTANCLAIEIGMGKRLGRALERLSTCEPRTVALGHLQSTTRSRYFLLMAGTGLDARIVFDVNPNLKRSTGKLAYWVAGLSQFIGSLEQFEARVEGKTYRLGFLLASRIRNYGGDLEIATGASLLHSDFEVVMFEGSNPLRYALYMLGVVTKVVRKLPGVYAVRAKDVQILSAAHTQIDGEYAGRDPLCLSIAPEPLTMLLPPTYG